MCQEGEISGYPKRSSHVSEPDQAPPMGSRAASGGPHEPAGGLGRDRPQQQPVAPATERVVAGFRRKGRDRGQGQVVGLSWGQADTVAAIAPSGGDSLSGLRDASLIALTSDAMLRVSELAALQVDDVAAADYGSGRVTIATRRRTRRARGLCSKPELPPYVGSAPGWTPRTLPRGRCSAAFHGETL